MSGCILRRSTVAGFLLLGGLFLVWEVIARGRWSSGQLPSIIEVAGRLLNSDARNLLAGELLATARLSLLGFMVGGLAGIGLGLIHGLYPAVRQATGMFVEGLRPLPSVALIPLGLLFLGMDESLNVAITAFACCWPAFVGTRDAVRGVSPILLETARGLGLKPGRIARHVILPAIVPEILTGLRIGLGIALAVEVSLEMVVSTRGIGALAMTAAFSGRTVDLYAAIALVGLLGFMFNKGFTMLQRMAVRRYGLSAGGRA
ncbi:MAG: ABC transporter permease subunit [Desulfocurvibacter africanus]